MTAAIFGAASSGGVAAKFLAVGNTGTITDVRYAVSGNGVSFTETAYSSSLKGDYGSGVFYGGNFYVPANAANQILKLSSGGVPDSYIQYTASGSNSGHSVTINPNNGRMVVAANRVGVYAIYYADPPYTSFTQVTGFASNVNQVAWLNDTFVALAEKSGGQYAVIWTSSDATSWTERLVTSNNADNLGKNAMLYANGHYVIGVGGAGEPAAYFYSSNGTSWSAITPANSLSSFGVARMGVYKESNGTFYLYNSSYVASNTNPSSNSSWTVTSLSSSGYDTMAISGDNIVMAKNSSLTTPLRYSTNGTTFSTSTHPFTSPAQNGIACLVGV